MNSQYGNLGSFVVSSLVDAGFSVTVVGRTVKKPEDLPAGVKSVAALYASPESLEAAFRGQDVIICTVTLEAVLGQKSIIDAAIKAGVKRFIPSDYGSITTDPRAKDITLYAPFFEIQSYLQAKADEGLIEYTVFATGNFTDFLLSSGAVFDWENKNVELWEGGHHPVSSTSQAGIAKAMTGALLNDEATKNKKLRIHERVISLAQILDLAKKHFPADTKWNITNYEDSRATLEENEKLAKESPELPRLFALVKTTVYGGLFEAVYEKTDNEVVGLELLPEEDLERRIAEAVKPFV